MVKIAFLYIKDESYTFLPYFGDFRGPKRWNLVVACEHNNTTIIHSILDKISKIAFLYIRYETYSFLSWSGDMGHNSDFTAC